MIKRYQPELTGEYGLNGIKMAEEPDGDWVRAVDYDTLDEECQRLRAIIKDATDSAKEAFSHLTDV